MANRYQNIIDRFAADPTQGTFEAAIATLRQARQVRGVKGMDGDAVEAHRAIVHAAIGARVPVPMEHSGWMGAVSIALDDEYAPTPPTA